MRVLVKWWEQWPFQTGSVSRIASVGITIWHPGPSKNIAVATCYWEIGHQVISLCSLWWLRNFKITQNVVLSNRTRKRQVTMVTSSLAPVHKHEWSASLWLFLLYLGTKGLKLSSEYKILQFNIYIYKKRMEKETKWFLFEVNRSRWSEVRAS